MSEGKEKDIVICTMCASREGPFRNVVQGGGYRKILGCVCPKCAALDDYDWEKRAMKRFFIEDKDKPAFIPYIKE